jgi:hypothetical protein
MIMKTRNTLRLEFSAKHLVARGVLAVSLCLCPALTHAEVVVQAWVQRYHGLGNRLNEATAVAVDGSNNVIVTGHSYTNALGYASDYVTIKYSSDGVPLWTNRYAGPGSFNDGHSAVVVDGDNNVIVTGWSINGQNYADYGTVKYSSAGVPLWTNFYKGPVDDADVSYAVAVDSSNSVLVTGYSYSSPSSSASSDYATIKYSSDGVPLWTNRYNGPGNGEDKAQAMVVDGSNNVIVTGYSDVSAWSFAYDYATIKYSSAGVPLWTQRYNGPGNGQDQASAMVMDNSGNVIVTGRSFGSGVYSDFATIKYTRVPSPVMTGLDLTNGTFQMRVDEVFQPGTLVIEASTDLAGWAPVFINTTPTNVLFYTDPEASNYLRRFYRAYQYP